MTSFFKYDVIFQISFIHKSNKISTSSYTDGEIERWHYHNDSSKERRDGFGVIRTGTLVACTKCSSGASSRKYIGEGGGAGAIMALGAHAADGSIISARVSHSHACDQTYPPVLTLSILETANPNSIVLQLLTASSRPEWRTRCFRMLWLLSRNRVPLTAPITRSLIGELILFEDSPGWRTSHVWSNNS